MISSSSYSLKKRLIEIDSCLFLCRVVLCLVVICDWIGHGGGWVCPGTEVHTHQVTPLARAGYKVFAYNYPLAPEDKFPTALVSTLKVLTWLYTEQGVRKVALVGER